MLGVSGSDNRPGKVPGSSPGQLPVDGSHNRQGNESTQPRSRVRRRDEQNESSQPRHRVRHRDEQADAPGPTQEAEEHRLAEARRLAEKRKLAREAEERRQIAKVHSEVSAIAEKNQELQIRMKAEDIQKGKEQCERYLRTF